MSVLWLLFVVAPFLVGLAIGRWWALGVALGGLGLFVIIVGVASDSVDVGPFDLLKLGVLFPALSILPVGTSVLAGIGVHRGIRTLLHRRRVSV